MPVSALALKTIELASHEVGQLEQPLGSNWGGRIPLYLAAVHISEPASWCSALACFCVQSAAQELGIAPELKSSASGLHLFELNPELQFSELTPDDVPCIAVFDHGKGLSHVVMVCGLNADTGLFDVIAGNTNDAHPPSRQGIGCFALEGRYSVTDPKLNGYLRIA